MNRSATRVLTRGVPDGTPAQAVSRVNRQELKLSHLPRLLSEVSARLVTAPADTVEEIECLRAFDEVRELLRVSRGTLYRVATERAAIDIANQAVTPGVEPLPQTLGAGEFAASFARAIHGAAPHALPEDRAGDRTGYSRLNSASFLAVPLPVAEAVTYILFISSARAAGCARRHPSQGCGCSARFS